MLHNANSPCIPPEMVLEKMLEIDKIMENK